MRTDRHFFSRAGLVLALLFSASGVHAGERVASIRSKPSPVGPPPPDNVMLYFEPDENLTAMVAQIVEDLTAKSKNHTPKKVSAALIDMGRVDEPATPKIGAWRGDAVVYPASVVKVVYMAAAYVWAERGEFKWTDSLKKELEWMIGPSSNTATLRILNELCGVESGDRLSKEKFADFEKKRGKVNAWLNSMGFKATNACQATWDGSPSPRDLQLMTQRLDGKGEVVNHNRMTAVETAGFFWLIATDRLAAPEDCAAMRKLMEREAGQRSGRNGYRKIFQDMLPAGTTIWGKSGFTSQTSHDAAIITTKGGRRFILVVFTEVNWDHSDFLGEFASEAAKRLEKLRQEPPRIAQGKEAPDET